MFSHLISQSILKLTSIDFKFQYHFWLTWPNVCVSGKEESPLANVANNSKFSLATMKML
jgi:hypothetical protein